MQFLFWLGNHNEMGRRSLEDVIGIMGHQLLAIGHTPKWNQKDDQFLDGNSGINVIVEGFTDWSIRAMAESYARGARFIILATEEPGPKGFNQGTQPEMVARQKMFPAAAKMCDGIIHLVPGEHVTRWYSQFAPAAYTELGYAPSLMRLANVEPDFDFGFYGSLTRRRMRILKRLANHINTRNAVKVMGDFKTQLERDADMRRARVIVQIRKFDEMGLVSSSRCNTALSIGRPVIAEPHLLSKPWDEIVKFSATLDGFFNDAILMRAAWKGVHAAQLARFKERLPPEACIGHALREIGIIEQVRRTA